MTFTKSNTAKTIFISLILILALTFTACGGSSDMEEGKAEKEVLKIGTKPMTESRILGEMLGLLADQAGYGYEITKDVAGGTTNIMPAMEKGDLDLYPEYTGTGWMTVLKHEELPSDSDELFKKLNEEYESQYSMNWVGLYGFNNTYAFAVSDDFAKEHDLKTMSDLAKVAGQAVFGGNGDYMERPDGFDAVVKEYGMEFKDTMDIDIGLKYEALESGDIDVTNAFTTDAQLSKAPVTVLKDDKGFFGEYFASTVVRTDALEKFPELEAALTKMNNLITDKEMSTMNYEVEVDGQDEKTVATNYLTDKGIIKASE